MHSSAYLVEVSFESPNTGFGHFSECCSLALIKQCLSKYEAQYFGWWLPEGGKIIINVSRRSRAGHCIILS